MNLSACDQVDIEFFNETDGDLTGHTAMWYSCRDGDGTNCNQVGSTLTVNNESHQGHGLVFGYCDVTNGGTDDLTCRARCNP